MRCTKYDSSAPGHAYPWGRVARASRAVLSCTFQKLPVLVSFSLVYSAAF